MSNLNSQELASCFEIFDLDLNSEIINEIDYIFGRRYENVLMTFYHYFPAMESLLPCNGTFYFKNFVAPLCQEQKLFCLDGLYSSCDQAAVKLTNSPYNPTMA